MTLASLERGRKYVIEHVNTSDPDIQRLMVLGLVEGAEVEMFGNAISLRREQAQQFDVTTAGAGE
jgi:Fe2+ transport system protein FeoA